MIYETVLGDTWDIIAFKIYKDEKRAKELVEANLDYITVIVFSAGVKLHTPEVIKPLSENLPPWKKRGINNVSS